MTAPDVARLGLRERKRLATKRAIQLAVLDLVAERGLDGVTVDEISRIADVSPRTFFNYFGSKEEAILGDPPVLVGDEAIERFVDADGNLLDDLAHVLITAGSRSFDDSEMVSRRHKLVRQYPHLFAMRMATMRAFEDQIASVVSRRLGRQDATLAANPEALANRARLVTLVSFGAMRHAWTMWANAESSANLGDMLRDSFVELRVLLAAN